MPASITIFLEKCTGCTLCVKACPFGAIHMANKKAVIDMAKRMALRALDIGRG